MVSVAQLSSSNELNKKNKIPEYAKDYKNEYLFIRGINKACGDFFRILDEEDQLAKGFDTPQAKKLMFYFRKFLRAQERGDLKDINEFYFEESDVNYIDSLESTIGDYMDLYYDPDSFQFNPEKYANDYPGLREFYECFKRFKNKINIKEMEYSDFINQVIILNSDSESDSDSDSD